MILSRKSEKGDFILNSSGNCSQNLTIKVRDFQMKLFPLSPPKQQARLQAMQTVKASKGLATRYVTISLSGLLSQKQQDTAELMQVIKLGTDSSAAKSFVNRRGLGKMRHIEVRDLWLHQEVGAWRVIIVKVLGDRNPADLMTKVLGRSDIAGRLKGMSLFVRE